MNSWEESACYPQSTFYPLSDGPSIQNHRITMTCFRTCSTCQSRSQAPLCHYTRRLVSNQAEGTFARLRYILGGDRPSQTARQAVSSPRVNGGKLESQSNQGGISLVDSTESRNPASKSPTYSTQIAPKLTAKLQ